MRCRWLGRGRRSSACHPQHEQPDGEEAGGEEGSECGDHLYLWSHRWVRLVSRSAVTSASLLLTSCSPANASSRSVSSSITRIWSSVLWSRSRSTSWARLSEGR